MPITIRVRKKPKLASKLPPAVPALPVRRFTVEEYHQMLERGILKDREPYELIDGWIVSKMGINPPHAYAVNSLLEFFWSLRSPNATVRGQQPITTNESEPEPDVVLAVGSNADYTTRHPKPAEVLILVEVSDSSLRQDQTTKLEIYAKAKIQVYWIVNLIDRRVEVRTQPRAGKKPTYRQRKDYELTDQVPVVIGGQEVGRIPVKQLMR